MFSPWRQRPSGSTPGHVPAAWRVGQTGAGKPQRNAPYRSVRAAVPLLVMTVLKADNVLLDRQSTCNSQPCRSLPFPTPYPQTTFKTLTCIVLLPFAPILIPLRMLRWIL